MATDEVVTDNTVDGAAAAIEALLKGPGTEEQPKEEPQIQPQAAAPQAQASEANASEDVQAPASDDPAPEAQPEAARVQPASSPELDARMQEAATKAQEAIAARDQFLGQLNALIPQLETAVKGQFADVKTQEDLLALGDPQSPTYNPERYNAAVIAFTRLNNAKQAQAEAQSKAQAEARAKFNEWQQGEMKKLGELIPELKDQTKGPMLANRIREYAKSIGYTDQQMAQASATDFVTLRNAMEYANLEKAKAEAAKKAAKAPPVQQPGVTRDPSTKEDKVQESFSRLQKTGRVDDAAQVMRNFL